MHPSIIPVDDPDDPRIETYRHIRERDLVGREGLFIAEGKVVLAMLVASSRFRPLSLLLAANRVQSLTPLLDRLAPEIPVYCAPRPVLDAIAGFPLHRGILAIGQRADQEDPETVLQGLPPRATALFLSAIANHDNIGGIFRNAAAFGVGAVLLDSACCDPLYRKAIRVSVGAVLHVPFARLDADVDGPALLARHGFDLFALSPAGRLPLSQLRPAGRSALLLGAEGPGLSHAILERMTTVRIEMAPGLDSLNVATATGIALHHFLGAADSA